MEQSQFAEFVAALWTKQGWQTQVTTKKGKSFVTLQREGAEGLIWARPATGEGVSGKELQQFVMLCKQYGVGEGAVVTSGTFSEDAAKIGSQAGVQVVDGEKLKTIIEARELHDLVGQYANGDGDGDGTAASESVDSDEDGFSLPFSLPDSVPDSLPVQPKLVAGVVVLLLGLVGAAVVAPMILGTGGQVETQDWNVTAQSTAANNSTDSLAVQWNAKRISKLDSDSLDSGDPGVYKPDEGKQFLLVTMNVTNEGNDSVGLKPEDFGVRSNGTLYGYQPLTNVTDFSPMVIEEGQTESFSTLVSIDADATDATLVVSDRAKHGGISMTFEKDSNLVVEP
ncbi:restriction endonuclease [Haladaptatus cibarius]|uniref:restriction endonuclease n=1 Tax=Haladaptatus cibarius TaxID=453847 RepID=UPI000A7CE5B8|nr:restriction endonuclease [Haladaptatus cibarius]